MPVRALRGAVVLLIVAGCIHQRAVTPAEPSPTPQGPSQSAAEAKRDGVPADVARMTLDQRTQLEVVDSPSITADEGVWRIARPKPFYGEMLLLDGQREHIIQAFPLPGQPYYVAMSDGAVYCAGTSVRPSTFLCRIDRKTHTVTRIGFDKFVVKDLRATDKAVYALDQPGGWMKLDPTTLFVLARGLKSPSG